MQKRALGVVLVAGLAMSGAAASTASNTFTAGVDTQKAGYGDVTASGVAVTDVDYNVLVADASKLDSVDFYTSDNVATGYDLKMTVRNGSTVVETVECVATVAVAATSWKIACNNADISLEGFDGVGLTVVSEDLA